MDQKLQCKTQNFEIAAGKLGKYLKKQAQAMTFGIEL
jgi:hypothetical protein